jgi:hypothetical protein
MRGARLIGSEQRGETYWDIQSNRWKLHYRIVNEVTSLELGRAVVRHMYPQRAISRVQVGIGIPLWRVGFGEMCCRSLPSSAPIEADWADALGTHLLPRLPQAWHRGPSPT